MIIWEVLRLLSSEVEKGRQHGNTVARKKFGSYDLQKIFGGTNLESNKRKMEKEKKGGGKIRKALFILVLRKLI